MQAIKKMVVSGPGSLWAISYRCLFENNKEMTASGSESLGDISYPFLNQNDKKMVVSGPGGLGADQPQMAPV